MASYEPPSLFAIYHCLTFNNASLSSTGNIYTTLPNIFKGNSYLGKLFLAACDLL